MSFHVVVTVVYSHTDFCAPKVRMMQYASALASFHTSSIRCGTRPVSMSLCVSSLILSLCYVHVCIRACVNASAHDYARVNERTTVRACMSSYLSVCVRKMCARACVRLSKTEIVRTCEELSSLRANEQANK